MEKTDIRVQFTRKVLRESLVGLMKEKPFLHISVREICETAGVSRSTFYAYYTSPDDLLRQMEDEILDEFDKLVQKHSPTGTMLPAKELVMMIEDVLQYIASNSNSVQVFISENGVSSFQRQFSKYLTARMRKFKNPQNNTFTDEQSLNYFSVFIRDGCTAAIQEWLKNGMDMSIPDMSKLITKLVKGGLG